MNVQTKAVDPLVEGGAQVQQVLNIECLSDFTLAPLLNIKFRYGGTLQNITLKLPVTLNKFFQATEMLSQDFFQRWKQLSQPQQEAQKIFKANHPMDSEVTKAKLLGFGCALLDKVDPNPDNYVGAGIIQTKSLQVGCLLRLEPNAQAQMYRLTLRTTGSPSRGISAGCWLSSSEPGAAAGSGGCLHRAPAPSCRRGGNRVFIAWPVGAQCFGWTKGGPPQARAFRSPRRALRELPFWGGSSSP
ncbi:unnamed protein product [Natator depressus]